MVASHNSRVKGSHISRSQHGHKEPGEQVPLEATHGETSLMAFSMFKQKEHEVKVTCSISASLTWDTPGVWQKCVTITSCLFVQCPFFS